jgi:hypothetical protein
MNDPTNSPEAQPVTDDQRKLRALLYMLTPVQMLEAVMEVIQRQRMNAPTRKRRTKR